jgi:haloalkane dehalogenase
VNLNMKLLRTPNERFENLADYPFKPNYMEVGEGIRIHYVDEGPKDSKETILLMHGEPTWSYLYRKMIPPLVKEGHRVVVPDCVGFGKSDKPASRDDHTYLRHVTWLTEWLKKLDLNRITLFCQDWGSLFGLRMAAENPDRFSRIVLSNGGLPTGDQEMTSAFLNWRKMSLEMPDFNLRFLIQGGTKSKVSDEVLDGYEAPFPDSSFKEGCRILPSLVPISPDDPESERNRTATQVLLKWEKPFLTCFADNDPVTAGGDRFFQNNVPGAKGQKHTTIKNAAHFVQEDQGPKCSDIIIQFIKDNPL